ncbi:MAG: hypothetical protein A3G49_04210 [Candidatus Sungbacteria bacterium RIFCSPLOWO2_12_FULL_41_11]|uniref:Uncharacterized protein n=1 Tax=Candidatus Sungbacteria bacterium RIFCSPLOWO2_12_FULL_41_11 TaxID=1802286 RepID=A0A1G2LTM6_9BACT|nr:MAG: hypothetical protein UV01_C0010G0025 [Parcubacteria group bacterium GW2011_GWA2_42_14]OGZ99339.1 MAG: hypothetical protein A3D41_02675 [Candidatus Sungbacteria bacterium RIFCSPHIGHO2_02_FULL_41_12b]OHA14864.1 MAG: hypothetical protein A3G49_04210 [Candidatus Sungbacteria bacterium RIFCSPLOWO2_12_FULL_41_11]
MNEGIENNQIPKISPAEKETRFQELLKKKEELVAAFQEALEKKLPIGDDDFMDMEIATEKAAKAALEANNQAEYDRLMEEHKAMTCWRFGE